MTRDFSAIDRVPDEPAVYVLFSGRKRRYVAYVGVAGQLRSRLKQHFYRRDSSVTTGTAAVSLNPERVCALAWWQHESFHDRDALEAAEQVAFGVFEPTLRSRGGIRSGTRSLLEVEGFTAKMRSLLSSPAHGELEFPSLEGLNQALEDLQAQVADLKARMERLEAERDSARQQLLDASWLVRVSSAGRSGILSSPAWWCQVINSRTFDTSSLTWSPFVQSLRDVEALDQVLDAARSLPVAVAL